MQVLAQTNANPEFFVSVSGMIDGADGLAGKQLYCRYGLASGPDWTVLSGFDDGLTAVSQRSSDSPAFVFAQPLDLTFRSTNISGWPRLVLSFFGPDAFGRDVPRGYAQVLLPARSGRVRAPVFHPLFGSALDMAVGALTGQRPALRDARALAAGDDRGLVRTVTDGEVRLTLDVVVSARR